MRLSADSDDPDYWRASHKVCPAVLLDGAMVDGAIVLADEEAGFVDYCPRDAAGKLVIDDDGQHFAITRKTGRVQIIPVSDRAS